MYELDDTIVAVSSATSDKRAIVRISGLATLEVLQRIFIPKIDGSKAGITAGRLVIDDELKVSAILYLFPAPNSYTGDCLAELHIYTNSSVVEQLISNLLSLDLRMASAGEFTARAYLNGKIDLAQAEAVGEIVASSNRFQLAAAEKLLAGSLSKTANQISLSVMDLLSCIEAGLDFSGEDIEFITRSEASEKLTEINTGLNQLLAGSISYESMLDLPSVGLAGLANAGKSSLLNKLLNRKRSIVSGERKTTRDILTGLLELAKSSCIIFDCAGLLPFDQQHNILDELAQQTAVESLQNASIVIFCVDISSADFD
ncbi:MAG: 50S ribosome-binding GTPase, partial [Planctomycetes bacterium]|nr:50S ribosome-binding GTPase [Planctomycetota bacterium]